MSSDRRDPCGDHAVLTTALAARWMGVETATVLGYIEDGELCANNVATDPDGRASWRIYYADFIAFLERRRWSRIPASPEELFALAGRRETDGQAT